MQTTSHTSPQDRPAEPSLEAALHEFNEVFNRFDTPRVAACWTEDGTLITPTGESGTGRDGVEKAYRHDCESILEGTRSTFTLSTVRRLGPDLAFLDVEHVLENARHPDGSRGTMRLHVVMLAQRTGGTWKWMDARPYAFLPRPPAVH